MVLSPIISSQSTANTKLTHLVIILDYNKIPDFAMKLIRDFSEWLQGPVGPKGKSGKPGGKGVKVGHFTLLQMLYVMKFSDQKVAGSRLVRSMSIGPRGICIFRTLQKD